MTKHKQPLLIAALMDDAGIGALLYEIKIAQLSGYSLIIYTVYPEGKAGSGQKYEAEFKTFADEICNQHCFSSYTIEYGQGYLPESVSEFTSKTEVTNVIFSLRPPSGFNPFFGVKFIKATKKIHPPFLIIQDKEPSDNLLQNIYIPVSHKKEGKEKLIWAETFCKDKAIKIKLVPAKAEEPLSKATIQNHLNFACRQFDANNIQYEIIHGTKNSYKIDQEVIEIAAKNKDGMVLITTTKHYGPEQELIGPPELKAIINKEKVPVLCINPRKDLHVLYAKY